MDDPRRLNAAYPTREAWLEAAAELMAPWLAELEAKTPTVRVSVGWAKRSGKAIGVCYSTTASTDFMVQILISPELDDVVIVLATLLHEQIHASDDGESKHSGHFRRTAMALGLEGSMTATVPGPTLVPKLQAVADELGPYPHARINPLKKIAKQGTRMIKVVCREDGYQVRTTKKWLELGNPTCPYGHEMEPEQQENPEPEESGDE